MLAVRDLACERQRRFLFKQLSFDIAAGELWQIRGSNGSGKTTLLKILSGLFDDYEGEVSWDMDTWPLYVGHRPGVKDALTCRENLEWLMRLHQDELGDLEGALSLAGLEGYENVPCYALSEGQRKRVSLARLFLSHAPVWILDEPFASIDTDGIETLEARIDQHLGHDGVVILTSHQAPNLERIQTLDL